MTDFEARLLKQCQYCCHIVTVRIPANCTSKLQPLNLTLNKPVKDHLRTHFQKWYAKQVNI